MAAETLSLPRYSDEYLAQLGVDDLWQLLIRDEDRVLRNAIDECARRGDAILDLIERTLTQHYLWSDDVTPGEAWLPLHAVMILGGIATQRAGELLVSYLDRLRELEDDVINDALGGYWPVLFANKPDGTRQLLRSVGEDSSRGVHTRVAAIESLIAHAASTGEALEETLAWAATKAFDTTEDLDLRSLLACTLIEFAQPQFRAGLEALADQQRPEMRWFGRGEIERSYDNGGDAHEWDRFSDPWSFYDPDSIRERQRQWAEAADGDWREPGETYVRTGPKIGRNDPCPCGSGKKYKKCCGI